MGYIMVRPRNIEDAKGFRGIAFPYPWVDETIKAYEDLGGPEHVQIVIIRREDGLAIDVQVFKPPVG